MTKVNQNFLKLPGSYLFSEVARRISVYSAAHPGLEGRLQPTIYGLPAFQTGAGELIEELTRRNDGPVDDREQGYSYAFLNISVGVYRSILPKDVRELIAEMEENGIPTLDDPDVERDRRRAEHWETIGIGVAGYYQ